MSLLIDISVPLHRAMTVWPNSAGFDISRTQSFAAGDGVNVSRITMDVHCGTHVEAPLHFIDAAGDLDTIAMDVMVGPAQVVELQVPGGRIGRTELEAAGIPAGTDRLLLRTSNSAFWQSGGASFRDDFSALVPDGAEWVVEQGIRLIGTDYLSVAAFDNGPGTHQVLMRGGVAILEGLNLGDVAPGPYRLICLPLRIVGAEAAPARALLESV
jgi:arylformamidase